MADALERQEYENEEVSADSVKCSACGSNLVFNPESKTLTCPHCGTQQSFGETSLAEELDLIAGFEGGTLAFDDKTIAFSCDSCGAKVVLNKNQTAKSCPFCGTAHVRKMQELSGVKPNAVIPFAFEQDNAVSLSRAWAKKRFFAPSKFKKEVSADNVKGVYVPCFTFDSQTTSCYEGRIGITKTRTVGSGKNKRTQTYVVWRNIRGTFNYSFDDLLVSAGEKIGQTQLNKISPFDTNNSIAFEEKCLLGFAAYHYDKELKDCWSDAKKNIDSRLRSLILGQYVHDRVAYLNVSTSHKSVTYKYVLLPVYVGNYSFKKKLYNFYVNGCTGKVCGKTPKSIIKILITAVVAIAVVVGIALLANGA